MKQRSGFIARHVAVRKVSAKRLAAEPRAKWSSITAPRKAVKARNAKRKAAAFTRAYGGYDRIYWLQHQPSVVSGARPCVCAHTRTGGAGRKADACWIVPLTKAEHDELHAVGIRSFEQRHGINLDYCAKLVAAEWRIVSAREET